MMISRNTVYNRFKDPDLSLEFISELGAIINYDFTPIFPEMKPDDDDDGVPYLQRQLTGVLTLQDKYTDLMWNYDKLMGFLLRLANQSDTNNLREEILKFLDEGKKLRKGTKR